MVNHLWVRLCEEEAPGAGAAEVNVLEGGAGISLNVDGAGATGLGRCEVERSCAIDYAIRRAGTRNSRRILLVIRFLFCGFNKGRNK